MIITENVFEAFAFIEIFRQLTNVADLEKADPLQHTLQHENLPKVYRPRV